MKKRTPSASISFSGAIGSSPAEYLRIDDREGLVEEAPGGVVIHRHPRAGDEVIRGRDIQDRDRFARMRFVDDAHFDSKWALRSPTELRQQQSKAVVKRAQSACQPWQPKETWDERFSFA